MMFGKEIAVGERNPVAARDEVTVVLHEPFR
jgi:hypothetical protein